jgi:predicted RND superfamily exporter protein
MKKTLMVARTAWMDALSYKPLTRHLEEGVERFVGERATVEASGTIYVDITIISRLLMDLLRSFGAALVVITVIMLILLREIKLGLLAMIPNLLPILTVMGFMGFVSIRLDLATILLGSLAIGIVVDDTIHYLHQFKAHFAAHGEVESAIQHAFEHTGRALVITSVMLTTGFACNVFAQLNNYKMAGLLLSLTIALALLIDLCVTPALLRAAYSSRSASPSRNSS